MISLIVPFIYVSLHIIVHCRLQINILEKKYNKAEDERQSKQSQLERELEEKQYELQWLEISLQKVSKHCHGVMLEVVFFLPHYDVNQQCFER